MALKRSAVKGNVFHVGQVIKFRALDGRWVYERIFAIGNCPRHVGLNWLRVTDHGRLPGDSAIIGRREDCGCLGDIKGGPYPLSKKERE